MTDTHSDATGSAQPSSRRAHASDAMMPVLYRSAGDGWRIGNAVGVQNPTSVLVHDARTGLPENVRPGDVVDLAASGVPLEELEPLLSSAQVPIPSLHNVGATSPRDANSGDEEEEDDRPQGQEDPDVSPSRARTLCLQSDDIAELKPSPLLFDGAVIDALRCRYRHGRAAVSAGKSEEDASVSTFVGDNLSYVLRSVPPSGIVPVAAGGEASAQTRERSLAARAHNALCMTNTPQVVLCTSDASPFGEMSNTTVATAQLMGATQGEAEKLAAALAIVQAFTHDVHGGQHAMANVKLFSRASEGHSYAAASIETAMLDIDRIATQPDANMEILGFLAYALTNEEKERCYLPTRKSAKPPACVSVGGQGAEPMPASVVDRLQQRYFVFCEALETLRFEISLQLFVFARMAAAMHLLEVQFSDDGATVINLAAMRSAAKLISADFGGLQKILTTRQHCVAAAKFLYMSTVRFMVSKLNARLNEEGFVDGRDGIAESMTLVSSFAPSADHVPRHDGVAPPVLPLHHLYRHVAFEDLAQRFVVSTDTELRQWQSQGFVAPRNLESALLPHDNYKTLKLLKARSGVLATIDTAVAMLFPSAFSAPDEEQEEDEEHDRQSAAQTNPEVGPTPRSVGQESEEPEMVEIPYWLPDRDAVAKMAYARILPEDEQDSDKPPKKAMPPVELPVRNDSLALMAFIFAGEVMLESAVAGTKLEGNVGYVLTISPAGNMNFWKTDAQRPIFAGNALVDVASLHIETPFELTMGLKPNGPKSKPAEARLRLLVRDKPNDFDAHNDLTNLLVRAVLHLSPKAKVSYNAAPEAVTPRETAEDRDEAAREQEEEERALAAAQAALSEDERRAQELREKMARVRQGFVALSKHAGVKYNEATHTLTVDHSFGPRVYSLPPLDAVSFDNAATQCPVADSWLTAHSAAFDDLRGFLLAETDVETQEALYVEEQEHSTPTLSGLFRADIDALLENTLARSDARFWFSVTFATAADRAFDGERVERQLNLCLYKPAALLRRHFPHHFLPITPEALLNNFLPILPGTKRIAFRASERNRARDRVFAEEICLAGDVSHVMGPSLVLISANSLLRLQRAMERGLMDAVATTQRFARSMHAAMVVQRRVHSITEALAKDDEERAQVIALRQWQIDNAAQHRARRLGMQEEEFTMRRAIADECWVEWVALQTTVQHQLEDAMQAVVARRVQDRQSEAQLAVKRSQRAAVGQLTQRIQQRMLEQGAGLDNLVRSKLANDAASRDRFEKMRKAQSRILNTKVAREEQRAMLEHQLEEKGRRVDVVAKQREARREEVRMELWHRQERERVVRKQIDANRQMLEQAKQEEMVMDAVSFKMRKRTEAEIAERQRAQRLELRKQYDEERKTREAQLQVQAKRQWSAAVRREKTLEQKRAAENQRLQKDRVSLFKAQERERKAAEKARSDEAQRQKILTRKLLKAHTMLYTPLLFEQSARGETRLVDPTTGAPSAPRSGRSKSAHGVADVEGFTMAGGKPTYRRMLPERVWDGIIRHHETALEREGSLPPSPVREGRGRSQSAARKSRLASASPRSVYSL